MTKDEARWLANSLTEGGWPEVWTEPDVYTEDLRVSGCIA